MTPNRPDDFVKTALDRMKVQGLRLTQPRKLVVETLAKTKTPLSAYRIFEQISEHGEQIDVVSIYRTLATLDSLGLVHFVHSADGFMPCTVHDHGQPGIEHAVCDDCGKVIELDLSQETTHDITGQLGKIGFRLRHVRVEIEGQCDTCANENAPGPI